MKDKSSLNLKGPILGIATVFFLQLGFMAYQAADRTMNLAYSPVNPINSASLTVAELQDLDDEFSPAETDFSVRKNDDTGFEVFETNSDQRGQVTASRRRPAKLRPYFEPDREASPDDFQATVITYRKPPEPRERTEYPKMIEVQAELPKETKRSFLSKTGRVLKKPYDWIKSIGTAFD